jgi:succinate dehydrogenase / fumarate reductase, cytochrome b subunit
VQRPLSPHIQIYKPQITSVMSILHRMTGAASIMGLVLVSLLFIAAPYGESHFVTVAALLVSWPGKLVLALFLLSFSYHLCNGIRHLVWDTGKGLSKESIKPGAVAVLVSAAVITLLVLVF